MYSDRYELQIMLDDVLGRYADPVFRCQLLLMFNIFSVFITEVNILEKKYFYEVNSMIFCPYLVLPYPVIDHLEEKKCGSESYH